MSVSNTPPPPPAAKPGVRKRGTGCFGCGCLIAILLVLIICGLLGAGVYVGYGRITSALPAAIPPSAAGTEDFYLRIKQKADDFYHDVKDHQAATIRLSGDEINAILARDPYLVARHIHLFVTIARDRASIQGSIPTSNLSPLLTDGRYLNIDSSFNIQFNPANRQLYLIPRDLQLGGQPAAEPLMTALQADINPVLNAELQKDPDSRRMLAQAKSIRLEDGTLVIETQ
jgi:hypothetical protein